MQSLWLWNISSLSFDDFHVQYLVFVILNYLFVITKLFYWQNQRKISPSSFISPYSSNVCAPVLRGLRLNSQNICISISYFESCITLMLVINFFRISSNRLDARVKLITCLLISCDKGLLFFYRGQLLYHTGTVKRCVTSLVYSDISVGLKTAVVTHLISLITSASLTAFIFFTSFTPTWCSSRA